jgi:hypothetical protein
MDKRRFLMTTALGGLLPAPAALAAPKARGQPALLTISGAVGRTNRAPFHPVIDQMMGKHGISFDKAYELDAAALRAMPAVTIAPTLEYDGKPHTLHGPLLATVLQAAGVSGPAQLGLRAVDGYRVGISVADATTYRMILATEIDGRPLALGGFGPQWAVYDADRIAPFKDQPLKQRFGLCPWGLYHIDVRAG